MFDAIATIIAVARPSRPSLWKSIIEVCPYVNEVVIRICD
jgi:hypothetical protein